MTTVYVLITEPDMSIIAVYDSLTALRHDWPGVEWRQHGVNGWRTASGVSMSAVHTPFYEGTQR